MKRNEFYVGQRVKEKDPDEGYMVYGHVMKIDHNAITVKWNDPNWGEMIIDHPDDELANIKDGNPT